MTLAEDLRVLFGLSEEVVSDELLEVTIKQAEDWCANEARAYRVSPPESAVALMAQVFLRQNLDLRGIKPSSISMPDLSMSTDIRAMCDSLTAEAKRQIKASAYANGRAVRHIRSGKVRLPWH